MCRFTFILILAFVVQLAAVEQTYVLDFSDNFGMSAFEEGGVPLRQLPSISQESYSKELPGDARYIIKLPSSNQVVFESHMGSIRRANESAQLASRLVLYGNEPPYHLTASEALEVFEQFHDTFNIPKEPLYKWFDPVTRGQSGRSYYQAIAKGNYPEIALEAANSFFSEKPVFLVLYVDFDEKTLRKRGVSAETNQVHDLTFDIPAIIESVRSKHPPAVIEETPVEESKASASATDPLMEEQVVKEPDAVAAVELAEEEPKESTNWLLWLIGALVVLGSLVLVVRRKN